MIVEKLEVEISAKNDVKVGLNQARDDIKGFNERAKTDTAIQLSINSAKIKQQLDTVKSQIKQSKKNGDFNAEVKLTANAQILQNELTQAKRELRNFLRTGEKDISVLGNLFHSVNTQIAQTREELLRAGKSTAGLDKITAELKSGKISAEQASIALGKINDVAFNKVIKEIEKTREELIKVGKDTTGIDNLTKKADLLQKEFKDGAVSVKEYGKQLDNIQKEAKNTGGVLAGLSSKLSTLVKAFLLFEGFQAIKSFFSGATKSAIEFESAFTGVAKTLDATPRQLDEVNKGLRALSATIPITFQELSGIAEIGGQLGVASQDIIKFTETVAKISVATNLTAEEASTNFARISNILQIPIENIDRMASSVVGLGNNFAANEKEILNFATNIAGAGAIAGLTAGDIFGISTAFTSVGIEAEAGGSAVQKVLLNINTAVATGGTQLENYAKVTGKSAKEFGEAWKKDAGGLFTEFVKALGKAGDQGVVILEELVGTDVRLQRAFLSLAQSSDTLTNAISTGNTEFEKNIALQDEAVKRFDTTESKIAIQQNRWTLFKVFLASEFLPTLINITSFFTSSLPIGFLKVQAGLTILIGKFYETGISISNTIQNIPGYFNIAFNNINKFISVAVNSWLGYFDGFVGAGGKLFSNLVTFIGVAISNIGPLVGKGLNEAIKPLNSFFNSFIKNYDKTLGKVLGKIGGNVSLGLDFGAIKQLPSLTAGVTEEFNKIKGASDSLSTSIINNIDKENEGYKQSIQKRKISTEQEIKVIETANNKIVSDTEEKIKQLQGIQEKASGERKKQLTQEIKDEQDSLKRYLEGLKDDDTSTGGSGKSDAIKKAEKEAKDLEKFYEDLNKKNDEDDRQLAKDKLKRDNELKDQKIKNIETAGDIEEKITETLVKNGEKIVDVLEKQREIIKDLRSDVVGFTNDILNIDEQISEVQTKGATDLANRGIELIETQKELKQSIKEAEQTGKLFFAQQFAPGTLKDLGSLTTFDIKGEKVKANELQTILETVEKLKIVQEELNFINANTTEETRRQSQEYNLLNESQKIALKNQEEINKLLVNKQLAEEQKAIAKAGIDQRLIAIKDEGESLRGFYEDEKGNLIEITDFKNIQYAQDISNKQLANQLELEQTQSLYQKEIEALRTADEERRKLEADYTTFTGEQIQIRKDFIDSMIQKANELKAISGSVGLSNAQLGNTVGSVNSDNSSVIVNFGGVSLKSDTDIKNFAEIIAKQIKNAKKTNS